MSAASPKDLSVAKQKLREQAQLARRELDDRAERSLAIARRLLQLPEYVAADSILVYLGVRAEVATDEIVASAMNDEKRVVVPYCERGELRLFCLREMEDLEPGAYGIPEPRLKLRELAERSVRVDQIDVMLIPGVGFDIHGNRCGHGKGYYDKLLAQVAPQTTLIALAFDCQVFPEIPTEPHDVRMNKTVTESQVYSHHD